MRLFEFTGVVLDPQNQQNTVPQYSYDDLRPYIPSPEQDAEYARRLRPYLAEVPLDERFANLKVRLAVMIAQRKKSRHDV